MEKIKGYIVEIISIIGLCILALFVYAGDINTNTGQEWGTNYHQGGTVNSKIIVQNQSVINKKLDKVILLLESGGCK